LGNQSVYGRPAGRPAPSLLDDAAMWGLSEPTRVQSGSQGCPRHSTKRRDTYMGSFLMVRPRIVYAVIICLGLSTTLPSAAQTLPDPKSLIGEWQGTYTTRSGSSGKVYLTISEATEKTFRGQQEVVASIGRVN